MPEADRTTPQTIKRRKKPKRTKAPSTTDRTSPNPTPPPKPKKGPPSPQRTGKATRPQPITRRRDAPPARTDRTSDAKRTPAQKARDKRAVDTAVSEARRRVLRRRGRNAVLKQVKKELEGRGDFAKLSEKAGRFLEGSVRLTSTGGGPTAISKLSQKATGTEVRAPRGAAAALSPKPLRIKGTVAGRIVKDFANLPAQALPSVYVPAAGVVEAAKGRPQRIKKFAEDFKQTDPIYNTAAAGIEAATGDTRSAKSHLRKAKKSVEEHPGFALVEAYGVKGAAGRGAGAAMRSGAVGATAKRAASTGRPDRVVPGTNIREQRTYSKDVLTKAGQKAVEKSRRRHARKLRERADAAEPGSDRAVELRDRAARVDPDRLPESEIKRRVDERVAVNEDVRRAHRGKIVAESRAIVRTVKREGHATSVVAQRIARADKADLRAYVRELEGQFDGLSNSGKRANKTLRREIEKVLADPKADLSRAESAAAAYEKLIAPLERKLVKRGLLGDGQEAKAKLIPYAVRNMGARHEPSHWVDGDGNRVPDAEVRRVVREDPTTAKALYSRVEARLVDAKGKPLETEAIRAHMKKAGVQEPAFITQAPNQRGARNFNVRSEKPVTINNSRRTGEATRKGTFDADPETLVEGAAKAQGLVDATDGFRKTIKENAARGQDGKVRRFKTYKEAQQAAKDLTIDANGDPVPGAHALRPVRLNPFGAKKEQLDRLLEDVDSLDQPQAQALVDAMREGLSGTEGKGPWALIPEASATRLLEHLNAQGGGGGIKSLQLANQAFRKTVLATSPSWMAGNIIEGLFRAGLSKAGPKSYARGRAALKRLDEIDPKAAEEAMSRIVGGGHFASADRAHIRRGAEQFEGTTLAPLATALGRLWRTPGPKQVAEFWNRYTDWVFNTVNGRVEGTIQTAMLGRALKDAGMKATEDAARGLKGTPAQIRFGREVDRMFGRYGKRSPAERKWFATYTPFAPWAINAAYFITRTLPRDHPVTTAVIAATVNATEEWRKDEGLDLFLEKGGLPSFLQGSIPTGGGAHARISRFTPFGAAGSPSETLAGQVMPLWTGTLAALKGKDWKGRDLQVDEDGKKRDANEIERFVFAARAFAEATVPIVGQAQRVAEQGPRALDPFRDVKPYESKRKKKLKIAKPGAGTGRRSKPSGSGGGSFFGGGSSSSGGSSGSSDSGSFF